MPSSMGFSSKYDSYIHLCDPVHLFSVEIRGMLKECILLIGGEGSVSQTGDQERQGKGGDCMWAFHHITLRFTKSKRVGILTFMEIVKRGKMPYQQQPDQVVRECWFLEGHWNTRWTGDVPPPLAFLLGFNQLFWVSLRILSFLPWEKVLLLIHIGVVIASTKTPLNCLVDSWLSTFIIWIHNSHPHPLLLVEKMLLWREYLNGSW